MSIKDVEFLVKDEKNHEIADQLVEYLQDLIRIASPSGEEEGIADYLMKFGEKRPLWNVERDEIDNIYFVPKGCEDQELAILMAHSDTHRKNKSDPTLLENVKIVKKYNNVTGLLCEYPNLQLGYDDKCGIAIILWIIANRPDLKFRAVITVQEEECYHNTLSNKPKGTTISGRSGGCGIQYALDQNPIFFNFQWGLLLDRAENKPTVDHKDPTLINRIRKEESDIIWIYKSIKLCNKQFLKELEDITKQIGTPMRRGESPFRADAMNIMKKYPNVSIVNLATGGYEEHSLKDYVNMFQVVRTLKVVEECLMRDKKLSNLARVG